MFSQAFQYVILTIAFVSSLVQGYPSLLSCDQTSTWIRGGPFNEMDVRNFATSPTACTLQLSPESTTYTAGQVFTVTVRSTSSLAYKVELVGGGKLSGVGGVNAKSTCLNFDNEASSRTVTFTAPTQGGEIRVKALCGKETVMNVATDIVLQAAEGVPPAQAVPANEDDVRFQNERDLNGAMKVFFSKNATHGDYKITYNDIGFVGFGIGGSMLGSHVILGVDPTVNPTMSAVGLYKLVSKGGNAASLVAGPNDLANFGVENPSYTVANGQSVLAFSLRISAQKSEFTLLGGSPVDVVFAAGAQTFSYHATRGQARAVDFATGGQGGGTPSSDPNFDFESALADNLKVFYKKNDTHGAFRVKLDAVGYVAMGAGSVMVGSNSIVAMDPALNPGFPAVGLYKLTTKVGTPQEVVSGLADENAELDSFGIVNASYVTGEDTSDLFFMIELAKQKPDFTLFGGDNFEGSVDIIYAAGASQFSLHNVFGSLSQINFANGVGGEGGFILDSSMAAHIAFMILAWEILVPFGVIIPLFNNAKHGVPGLCKFSAPSWFKFHWVALTFGILFGFIGTITGFIFVDSRQNAHLSSPHKVIGLLILISSIAQGLWGKYRPAKPKTGEAKSASRQQFESGHPAFGYTLLFSGLLNCLIGVAELERVAGGQDYVFNGVRSGTGFDGTTGAFVVVLFTMYTLMVIYGVLRSWQNSKTTRESMRAMAMVAGKEVDDSFPQANNNNNRAMRTVSWREVQASNSEFNCWVVYNGRAFNVTSFLASHPGGKKVLLQYAGKDITTAFNDIGHSQDAIAIMSRYLVGLVGEDLEKGFARGAPPPVPMAPKPDFGNTQTMRVVDDDPNKLLNGDNQTRHVVTVMEKIAISHNVFMLKLSLPRPQMVLGLPFGKHICIYAPVPEPTMRGMWNERPDSEAGRKEIQRKYTPVSLDSKDIGYFTLVVKCYRPDAASGFPDGGKMSRYLDSLVVGSTVIVSGPFGAHQYLGNGRFVDSGREIYAKNIAMVAGGSGITPIFQLARAMLLNPSDNSRISIVYANSSFDDILIKTSLDELERKFPKRIQIWYTISRPPPAGKDWRYSIGRITKEMLEKRFPPPASDALVISCGPPGMMAHVHALLDKIGFPESHRIEY